MTPERVIQAYPPRLMSEPEAARYLSIGTTTLRDKGPIPKRLGKRVLYDIRDLDRWADRLDGQPAAANDEAAACLDEEARFFARRNGGR